MQKRNIVKYLFFLLFFLKIQLIFSQNSLEFIYNSIEDVQCPKNGKGYNFQIYGTLSYEEVNIEEISITDLEIVVGSQTTTANCYLKKSIYYYFDCYITNTELTYNNVVIKLTSNTGTQNSIIIKNWPISEKSKIITDNASCLTITNYIKASYYNKGKNCIKSKNLDTYEFSFVVEFFIDPSLDSVTSSLLKENSFNLPITNPKNAKCICTFDNNYLTSTNKLNCIVSEISENNKLNNLLTIGDTSDIKILIEDSSKILGIQEFSGTRGLGIQCPSDNISPINPDDDTTKNNTKNDTYNDDTKNNTKNETYNDETKNDTNNNTYNDDTKNNTNNNTDYNNTKNDTDNNNTDNNNYTDGDLENCKIFNDDNKCLQCFKGYYLVNNGTICATCSNLNPGCSECNSTDYKICITCSTNFEKNGDSCIDNIECPNDLYGAQCKTCSSLNSNCEECNESGFCKKCKDGYFLLGVDSEAKCKKCLSNCLTCTSNQECLSCNEGFLLKNGKCVPCFAEIFGCKNCNSSEQCTQCYNYGNFDGSYLLENKCVKTSNNINNFYYETPKMNFQRIDNFNIVKDKLFFKTHFFLLDSTLVNSNFNLQTNIYYTFTNNSNLRNLNINNLKTNFNCEQYGISSATDLNQERTSSIFLVNYLCKTKLDDEYSISQVNGNLANINISDPFNRQTITNGISSNDIDISKYTGESLDEEIQNSKIYIYSTNEPLDYEYDCEQNFFWFSVSGDLSENINENLNFKGYLINDSSKEMECVIYENNTLNNKILYCIGYGNDFQQQKALIQDGIYSSNDKNDVKLFVYNKKNIAYNEAYCNDIKAEESSSSSGLSKASIALIVVGIILLVIIGAVIAFFVFKNKDMLKEAEKSSNNSGTNNTERKSAVSDSKEEKDASDGNAYAL